MSLTSEVKLHIHLLNEVVRFIVSSLLQLWYLEVRISRSVSESPLEFEITRVDCNVKNNNKKTTKNNKKKQQQQQQKKKKKKKK